MGRIKRYKWLLIVLTLCVAFGGVAYAGYNVAVVASSPSDQWHACVSNTGVVRAPTMRLNSYPTSCPRSTDTIRSWNASGPSGANGATGPSGLTQITGATGVSGSTGPSAADQNFELLFTFLPPTTANRWVMTLQDVPAGMYMFGMEAYVAGGSVNCSVAVIPNAVWPTPKTLGTYTDTGLDPYRSYRIMRADVTGDVTFECLRAAGTPVSMDGTPFAIRL